MTPSQVKLLFRCLLYLMVKRVGWHELTPEEYDAKVQLFNDLDKEVR